MLKLECPVLQWGWLCHLLTGASHEKSSFIYLGVDTHLDIHVSAVFNYAGKLFRTKVIRTNLAGYQALFDWMLSFGSVERAGIEGTGTYGAGLTRFLIKKRIDVLEINRPARSKRRFEGKSDSLDVENAARTVLSGSAKAVPKLQSGACKAVRIISVAHRSAVKAKIQAPNVPQDNRHRLRKSKPHECVTVYMSFESSEKSPLLLWHFVAHFEA